MDVYKNEPEVIESEQSEPPAQSGNKKIFILLGAVFLIIVIFIGVLIVSSRSQNSENQAVLTPHPTIITPTLIPLSPTPEIEMIEPIQPSLLQNYFYSDDGNNAIYFFRGSETEEQCTYFFVSRKRKYSGSEDTSHVFCTTGVISGNVDLNSYKKWVDSIYFVSDVSNADSGKIVIFDSLRNFLPYEYIYFRDKYSFISVDDSLKYWLFKVNISDEKDITQFEVFDKTKKSLAQINIDTPEEWQLFETLYDTVNKGYVFILRKFAENQDGSSYVEVRIDFFSMEHLQLKNAYSGLPILTEGRGCGSTQVISRQKNQILLRADCFEVPQEYLDLGGNMKFTLP